MRRPCRPGSRRPGRGRPGAPGGARRGAQFADACSEYPFQQGFLALNDDRGLAFGDRLAERRVLLQALLLEGGIDDRAGLLRLAPEDQPVDELAALGDLLAGLLIDLLADLRGDADRPGALQQGLLAGRAVGRAASRIAERAAR